MGFFQNIKGLFKNKPDTSNYHQLTEEDYASSAEVRRIKREIRRTKELIELEKAKAELMEIRQELYEEDEEDEEMPLSTNPDIMLMSLFNKLLNPSPSVAGSVPTTSHHVTPTPVTVFSEDKDAQIREILSNISPTVLEGLKTLPDTELKKLIKGKYPPIDEATLNRSVEIIKYEN